MLTYLIVLFITKISKNALFRVPCYCSFDVYSIALNHLITGAKICRGFEGQKSRCRDKPKCQKSRHCRGKSRKNRGDIAAEIVKIAAISRQKS